MDTLGGHTGKFSRRDRFPAAVLDLYRRLDKTGKFLAVKARDRLSGGQVYLSASVAMPQFDPVS